MSNDEATLRNLAEDAVKKIAGLRDDVRVRLHLAGMEAKDAWKEAEPHVERAESHLRSVLDVTVPGGADAARLQLSLGLKEARENLKKVEPQLRALGNTIDEARHAAIAGLRDALSKIELG